MSSKGRSKSNTEMDALVAQFTSVTGASAKDARKFLTKYKRLDQAVDAFYSTPAATKSPASTSKLNAIFDKYKAPDSDDIAVEGTIKLCEDLEVDPEEVVLLAVAFELKSPAMGEWSRKGFVDGWKALGADSIEDMKAQLVTLRQQLAKDTDYFRQVYNYTFEFSRPPGQRSLALDMAEGFWQILIPLGLAGGALAHISSSSSGPADSDGDEPMDGTGGHEAGWTDEHTGWWIEFLQKSGAKGVSKDVWQMFMEFVQTIDARFEKYDMEAAWPSTIDDFVEYAKERVAGGA